MGSAGGRSTRAKRGTSASSDSSRHATCNPRASIGAHVPDAVLSQRACCIRRCLTLAGQSGAALSAAELPPTVERTPGAGQLPA